MDISKMMKKKEAKGVFTLKRNDVAREELKIRSLEVASWLAITLGNDSMKSIQESDAFFSTLQDGVILCQLIEKVAKDITIKYRSDAKPQTFPARENITHFLEASKKLGVPTVSLFEADDLVARKNDKAVVNALLQLSRVTAKKYNIEPPTMIKYEMEIEEEQNKKEEQLKEEEEEKDEKDEEKSDQEKDDQESPKESSSKQDEEQKEQEPIIQKKSSSDQKASFHFLPYLPKKGSDIDQLVAKALNDNLLDVDVKQVQIKNKKRRRDTKHKGEYLVNGHRVPVRMLQGVLVVRVQNEWLNFVRFAQEQLGYIDE